MDAGRARSRAWEITIDFIETVAFAAVAGALASLALAALALLLAASAEAAEGGMDARAARSGTLLLRTKGGGEAVPAPLVATDVQMKVAGLIARVRVTQRFGNPSGGWQEGVYVFPLPENAAVDALSLRVGTRTVDGVIREREAARHTYEKARDAGQRGALVEQERPNLFTTSVANIGPGETVEVAIEYQQTLRYDAGQFTLRFPLAITPRYIPDGPVPQAALVERHQAAATPLRFAGLGPSGWALGTDAVPDAERITPPVPHPATLGERVLNPVSIEIELDAGLPLALLESRSHDLRVERRSDGRFRMTLAAGAVPSDRDFELAWRPSAGQAPRAALFQEQRDGATYALLMVMPPDAGGRAARLPREAVFVIDTSGSMEGASIVQAREALTLALARLQPGDTFNVIEFNSVTRKLFPAAQPVTSQSLEVARRWVSGLRATGGTEMRAALGEALDGREHHERLRQVVFLTDGAVGNEEQLFGLIRSRLGASRLFTVGIGAAPNSHFMTRAAQLGGGTFTYIGRIEDVAAKMGALFAKLEAPVLRDVAIDWPAGVEAWPRRIPDLYLGEPVVVAARIVGAAGSVTLRGERAGAIWTQTLALDGGGQDPGVGKLWARHKIDALIDAERDAERDAGRDAGAAASLRSEIVKVALAHELVSRYTSLVAVDTTPARPAGEPLEGGMLPVNLPHGMVHEAVFGELPQTATPAQWHLLLATLALVAALLLSALRPRRTAQWSA
jgi:Ca-activated chloride channel family protein